MPVRRDLFSDGSIAHVSLKDEVKADRFTEGTARRIASPAARLCHRHDSPGTDRQIIYGHKITQLEPRHGLSRDETSGYVGYVSDTDTDEWAEPTHRVAVRTTLLFNAPDFKSPDPLALSAGSLLRVVGQEGKYARTHDGRYAIANHLQTITNKIPDLAATAERLLDTPYLWGGNSAFGIDCSGLVQLACEAAHVQCPGDSDQQMSHLGLDLPQGTAPKRNDMMFWKGHVALLAGPEMLIHANAHHMVVAREPLQDALKRIERQGDGPLLAHKRL